MTDIFIAQVVGVPMVIAYTPDLENIDNITIDALEPDDACQIVTFRYFAEMYQKFTGTTVSASFIAKAIIHHFNYYDSRKSNILDSLFTTLAKKELPTLHIINCTDGIKCVFGIVVYNVNIGCGGYTYCAPETDVTKQTNFMKNMISFIDINVYNIISTFQNSMVC